MILGLFVSISSFFTLGCVSRGPAFQPAEPNHSESSIVYLYRHQGIGANTIKIKVNGEYVTALAPGEYFPFICKPRAYDIEAGYFTKSSRDFRLSFYVEEGKTYFLKYDFINLVILTRTSFKKVDPDKATVEIEKCTLASPYSEH
jgi:hypothetical protein